MRTAGTAVAGCLVLLAMLAGCGNRKQCKVTYVKRGQPVPATAAFRSATPATVAVLPFRCVAAPEVGYTVAAAVAGRLGSFGGCEVVEPATVASTIAGSGLSPVECGAELGASHIVVGEVVEYVATAEDGDRPAVGVEARLIETASGRVVWQDSIARHGSAEWYPDESIGVLTTRVSNDLAVSVDENWREFAQPRQTVRRRASVTVPEIEVDDRLEEVEFVEEETVFPVGDLIDFPEEVAPEQFGLEQPAPEQPAQRVVQRPALSAPAPKAAPETAVLPVVPTAYPPEYYVLPPDEAGRILEMFEDPYAPELERAAAAPAAPRFEAPVDVPAETTVTEAVPAAPVALVLPDLPDTVEASAQAEAPAEMVVPVSLGLELEDEPEAAPAELPKEEPASPEIALDHDRDFLPPVSLTAPEETVAAAPMTGEDELDFFGRMSASLDLQLPE